MENKDYLEIFDEENGSKKMEVVFTFELPSNPEYNYIIYKEIDSSEKVFAGKMKKQEDSVLETNLSDEEKKNVQIVFDEMMKSDN